MVKNTSVQDFLSAHARLPKSFSGSYFRQQADGNAKCI